MSVAFPDLPSFRNPFRQQTPAATASTIDQSQRAGERAGEGAGQPYVAPAPARTTPTGGGGGGGGGYTATGSSAPPPPAPSSSAPWAIGTYTKLVGDPATGAVPPGEYNVIESLMQTYEALVGFSVEPSTQQLLDMANRGVETLLDFGKYMSTQPNAAVATQMMPWANYGLTKDEYQSAAGIYGTEYKKITGQDISPEALQQAFQNPQDRTGGLISGTQYQQQLMNDAAIQKQFGWVKYGLDFSAWTQQKLSMRTAFGRDINDSEAATILQYNKSASGSNMSATARQTGQQSQGPVAVGGSVVR